MTYNLDLRFEYLTEEEKKKIMDFIQLEVLITKLSVLGKEVNDDSR